MLSSHNFYKSSEMVEEKKVRKIETSYTIKKKEPAPLSEEENKILKENYALNHHQQHQFKLFMMDLENNKKHLKTVFKKERDKFFTELREMKQHVLEQAKLEGEALKEEAYQEGLKEGQKDGYESGLENGYEAGKKEANHLKENANQVIEQAREEMRLYQKNNQHEFIELATIMAETIINRELSLSETDLKFLLDPIINKLEKADNFITVYVPKANLENTKNYMNDLKDTFSDMKFAVLVDESLEKNGCVIETNYEVIDLRLRKQLDQMLVELTKEGPYE